MTASENLDMEMAPGGSEWLFRQGELVLGPVPAQQIVEKLYSGELTGRSEISSVGQGHFQPIAEVDEFKLHVAKAEVKARVEASAQAEQQSERKRRNRQLGIVVAIGLLAASTAAILARHLAVHNPLKNPDELAFGDITVEPPTIMLARASHVGDEDLLDYPLEVRAPAERPREQPLQPPRAERAERPRSPGKRTRASAADEEPDGLQTAKFDQGAINAVVAAKQRTLYVCFAEQSQRQPGFSAKIPIEFVIGNDGRVSKLWVDNPNYKEGPLADCLLRELRRWPFKPYEGEQATVGLSFKIGKGG